MVTVYMAPNSDGYRCSSGRHPRGDAVPHGHSHPPQLCLQLQNITIEGASIVDGDNAATNGVIHVINKVKMPLPTRQNCFPLCDGFLYSAIWGQIKKILSLNIKRTLSVFHLG